MLILVTQWRADILARLSLDTYYLFSKKHNKLNIITSYH